MPCYTKWSENLGKESDGFDSEKQSLLDDYDILKRVISFYYDASEQEIPNVQNYLPKLKIDRSKGLSSEDQAVMANFFAWELSETALIEEEKVFNQIALHILCDGRH